MKHSSTRTGSDGNTITQLFEILSRLNSKEWKIWEKAINLTMQKKNPWTETMLNTYNYFLIGGEGLSFDQLREQLKEQGVGIMPWLDDISNEHVKVSTRPKEVPFALKTMQEIDFTGKTYGEWIRFINQHTLYDFCRPEDVFYLRQQESSLQTMNIAMRPIIVKGTMSKVLNLDCACVFRLFLYHRWPSITVDTDLYFESTVLPLSECPIYDNMSNDPWFLRFKK